MAGSRQSLCTTASRGFVAVGEDDGGALLRQTLCGRGSDAGARPGDHRDLAGETTHHCALLLRAAMLVAETGPGEPNEASRYL